MMIKWGDWKTELDKLNSEIKTEILIRSNRIPVFIMFTSINGIIYQF